MENQQQKHHLHLQVSHTTVISPEQVQSNIDSSDLVVLNVNHILLTDSEEATREVILFQIRALELRLRIDNKTYNVWWLNENLVGKPELTGNSQPNLIWNICNFNNQSF